MALGQRQALPGQIRALRKYELAISPSFRDIPRGSFNSERIKGSRLLRRIVKTNLHLQVFQKLLTVVDKQDLIHGRHFISVKNFICKGADKFSNHAKLESEMFYEA